MIKRIESLQNSTIKEVVTLKEKSRTRKKTGTFLIEGSREIILAQKGNYQLETLFYCPELSYEDEFEAIDKQDVELIEISKEVYQKIAYRESTEGILAIAKSKEHSLSNLSIPKENALILIAEAPEKPGNIGALLRTADAANIDAVIIANPKTDLYNPNIIRSSVGCVFTNQIATASTAEVINFIKEKQIPMYGAALTASVPYHTIDFRKSTAIVVGTEASGLSEEFLQHTEKNIIIPMQGEIDSMNVSVSAAIVIFEAKRQRNFQ
ncbi:TrmH family RNA methyltransferase [Spongiivirga citrea]|uniref:RNA methyltransferase n=1 Tax=Spongiivirga citrea TaxID=1481457 RepID=A0A6M0CJ25_9FLAO|nr:RNA methyltransferase [Spongiivirga citrea]NER15994.1 RNA methyltransferase [Spongiivirga citrea]